MFFDSDTELVRLPVTFRVKDMGVPTPGTTNLYEPTKGELPPPPLLVPDNAVRHPSAPPVIEKVSPYASVNSLCNSLGVVTAQAVALEVKLYEMAKAEEEKAPLPVLMVRESRMEKLVAEKCRQAQQNCLKRFAMATLVTTDGQLQIGGLTPGVVVIDTGTSTIILGIVWVSYDIPSCNVHTCD